MRYQTNCQKHRALIVSDTLRLDRKLKCVEHVSRSLRNHEQPRCLV